MYGNLTTEVLEKTLRNICARATSEEALRESVAKLGLPKDFCVIWEEHSLFAMLRAPDGEIIFSGYRKPREYEPPKPFYAGPYGQEQKFFGWFIPYLC